MNNLVKAIQQSFDLLDLKKNWDKKGASPVNKTAYIKAMEYMLKIMDTIDYDIKNCEITACSNGTIDINFHNGNARLSIHINDYAISYEGTGHHKDDQIKTINNTGGYLNTEVIDWLNRNCKKSA